LTGAGGQTGNDFGNFQAGTVTGTKFKDKDDDGVRDAGEQGLGGWEIHAFNAGSDVHTTTASDGTYSFTLLPGTYTLCETLSGQTGWVQSAPATGADCSGHTHGGTITPGATGYTVTVVSQGTVTARDFGNTPLSKVKVDFLPQATLPGGGDATHATSITCTPGGGNTNSNTFTTDSVRISQGTTITCVITYVDP